MEILDNFEGEDHTTGRGHHHRGDRTWKFRILFLVGRCKTTKGKYGATSPTTRLPPFPLYRSEVAFMLAK